MKNAPFVPRRRFIHAITGSVAVTTIAQASKAPPPEKRLRISCRESPWARHARLKGIPFVFEEAVAGAAQAGLSSLEPIIRSLDQVVDQATEKGTPSTLSIIEAHRKGREHLVEVFGS